MIDTIVNFWDWFVSPRDDGSDMVYQHGMMLALIPSYIISVLCLLNYYDVSRDDSWTKTLHITGILVGSVIPAGVLSLLFWMIILPVIIVALVAAIPLGIIQVGSWLSKRNKKKIDVKPMETKKDPLNVFHKVGLYSYGPYFNDAIPAESAHGIVYPYASLLSDDGGKCLKAVNKIKEFLDWAKDDGVTLLPLELQSQLVTLPPQIAELRINFAELANTCYEMNSRSVSKERMEESIRPALDQLNSEVETLNRLNSKLLRYKGTIQDTRDEAAINDLNMSHSMDKILCDSRSRSDLIDELSTDLTMGTR